MALKRMVKDSHGAANPSSSAHSRRRLTRAQSSSSSTVTSGTPLSRSETPSTSPEPDVKTEEVAADAGRVKSEDPEEELQLVPVKEAEREDVKPVAIAPPRKRVKEEMKEEEEDDEGAQDDDESEDEAADFPGLVEAMGDVDRPAELSTDSNLLRPASLSTFDVDDEDTRELRELGMFARRDLGGNEQSATDKTQKRIDGWGTMRKCWRSSRNLGGRGPGKAFLVSTTPHPVAHKSRQGRFSLFLRLPDSVEVSECWQAYGVYRYHWCGFAKEGEFDRLTEKEKDQVVDVFCSYLRGGKNKFVEWLFRDIKVQLNPKKPKLYGLWTSRMSKRVRAEVRTKQQRLAIKDALSQNNVLPQGWAIMVYDGPLPPDELDFIKRRRDVRRAGGDPRAVLE